MIEAITFKECRRCGELKPDYQFYRNRHSKGGWMTICRVCSLKYSHERYHRLKANDPLFYVKERAKAAQRRRNYMMKIRPWRVL